MKILLADDSPDTRLLLQKILRQAGYHDTLSASSAHDVFKHLDLNHAGARAEKIDLILLDVRMPEIDGIEVCRRIKAVEALHEIPIIMVSVRYQPEVLRDAFDAGAMDYIKKPLEEIELLARVKAALKLKKEIDARKHWEQELIQTVHKLEAASHEMVTLLQLISICPACKVVLADQTLLSVLETYIQTHPNAKFNYSVCSSCSTSKG